MTTRGLDHEIEFVPSSDETVIATRCFGSGSKTPLLVCNAIGAGLSAWRNVLIDIVTERRVIMWDHRGLHDSLPPSDARFGAEAQTDDAVATLDHYGVEEVVLASWSTGGRIALELSARIPQRVPALALVCGSYGVPLARFLKNLEIAPVLPRAAGLAKHFGAPIGRLLRSVAGRPELAGLIRQSGMVGPTADTPALVDLIKDISRCDPHVLLSTFEAVAGDVRAELLDGLKMPVLLVGGERDQFATRDHLEETRERIHDARLTVYDRATHYLPLEFPSRLGDDLEEFFSTHAQ